MASLSRDEDVAGGFDAPRNSLDEPNSIETTKSVNCHKPEDIPFGYEICDPARDEKRRGPNVVARLMGLDTMPDDRHKFSSPKMPRGKLRKTHPQDAELQKFKKEFEANNTNRQLEDKKRKVRAMLDKARLALSQGKKFEESKEFLEAMEFLQCNKDFIFQFLQEKPHAVFSLNASGTPRKQQQQQQEATITSPRKQSTDQRRQEPGFNPRALARLFIASDPCKGNDHKSRTPTSTTSRYLLPASPRVENNKPTNKKGARDIIVEIKERLRRREQESKVQHTKALRKHEHHFKDESQETSNFTLTKSLSTGKRISMMRPDDMSDGEISTPKTLQITESFAAAETKKKKTSLASPRSSAEKCAKPICKSENATGSTVNNSPRLSHSSVNDSNLTRCRSVPNVALLREQCAPEAPKNTSPKVAKPTQNGADKKLGLVSVGRKKGPEAIPNPKPFALQRNAGSKNGKDSNLRETKVRRNILDAASDRNGLLSTVSVSESSLQFKDITNDLQDRPQVRLQRPKLDGSIKKVRDDEVDCTTRERRRAEVPHQSPRSNQINAERRPGTALDFAFVRDILVASGFHLHGGRNITRWHSATQPISHRVLAKVESSTGTFRRSSGSSLHWRSLFDAINEVLIAKLEQSSPAQCYGLPLVGVPSSAASGRRFVEDVWSEIHKRLFTSCQEDFLHSLVAQDLQTTRSWLLLRRDVDRICLQLEKAIWDDLVEEILHESVH